MMPPLWLEETAMAVYAFDVDETLEVSKGPVKLFDLVTLREHGHIVGLCGNWAMATTAIFCFLFAWNDFFYALVLTRSQAQTAPVAIVNFMNYEGWEWGKIGAGGTMIMVPVVLFSLMVRRYLVRGLTVGATKG